MSSPTDSQNPKLQTPSSPETPRHWRDGVISPPWIDISDVVPRRVDVELGGKKFTNVNKKKNTKMNGQVTT